MDSFSRKLNEIESGTAAAIAYSTKKEEIISSINSEITIPLASAGKLAIGFCVTKWAEEDAVNWDNMLENISFNPNEDSKELYPHLQGRKAITLRDAVEVMIACHDSFIAHNVVQYCGGWEKLNEKIKSYFPTINVTQNPLETKNCGELRHVFDLFLSIFNGYKSNSVLWLPVINGLVRQQDKIEEIPHYLLNHMTGGLPDALLDVGILGAFHEQPIIFIIGAKNLPNRSKDQSADDVVSEAVRILYRSM